MLATDEGAKYGLFVTKLAPETAEMLDGIFPRLGKIPMDIGPPSVAIKDFYVLYPKILNAVMSDENVDSLFNVLWVDVTGKIMKAYVETYEQLKGHFQKPLVTWIGGPDSSLIAELTQRLEELGFSRYSVTWKHRLKHLLWLLDSQTPRKESLLNLDS